MTMQDFGRYVRIGYRWLRDFSFALMVAVLVANGINKLVGGWGDNYVVLVFPGALVLGYLLLRILEKRTH